MVQVIGEKVITGKPLTSKPETASKHPYLLVGRECHDEYRDNLKTPTFFVGRDENRVEVGGDNLTIIAGPCAVYTLEHFIKIAEGAKEAGADMIRGGIYKPRTSPYSFQGIEESGLKILAEVGEKTGLPIVTEVMATDKIDLVGEHTDVFQIGARNMFNYDLLKKVGKIAANLGKCVVLKTGMSCSLDEVCGAAEYLAIEFDAQGKEPQVILCDRGTNISSKRNGSLEKLRGTPRPEFLAKLRKATYLPVIADPSHCTGNRDLVWEVAMEYLNAGANGLMIELIGDKDGPNIEIGGGNGYSRTEQVCDYNQGLRLSVFKDFMETIKDRKVEQEWIEPELDLDGIRKKIGHKNDKLLELLAERSGLCRQVGEYKREHGLEVLDRKREEEIIREGITKYRELGYDNPEFITKLFELILEESRRLQNES